MDEITGMEGLKSFTDSIDEILELDEEDLSEDMMGTAMQILDEQMNSYIMKQASQEIIDNLEAQGLNKKEAEDAMVALKDYFNSYLGSKPNVTGLRKQLIDHILDKVYAIFSMAVERYHSYSIELPIMLEEGAHVPTYAHETDAAADLYAMEDVEIPAHYTSVPVQTGVHIQLPEGWVAMIFPRSSIGAKTPLRLSNSAGIIDSKRRSFQWAA